MKFINILRWLSAIIPVIIILIITPDKTTSFEKLLSEYNSYPKVFPLTSDDINWIESTIKNMTLEEKCAQLVMPAVYREQLQPDNPGYADIDSLVRFYKVGGLILFQGDLKSQAAFINVMQSSSEIPLLIGSDFERGLGTRIDDAVEFPHAMAIGATQEFLFAEEMSSAISDESVKLGVNINFAPVSDINNNSDNPVINIRSFSEKEKFVTRFAVSFLKGSENKKIILTAKHFPGHGNTSIDSHRDLPRIEGSGDYLEANELVPFETLIRSGVKAVMVGHLEVPSLDPIPGTPASLSKPIVTFLLRDKLGFDGLIFTDAMNMEAITRYYSSDEAAVLAITAGNDIILMPGDPKVVIKALVKAVNSGKLTTSRIEESVRRILSAKRWLGLSKSKGNNPDNLPLIREENQHLKLANIIAEKSITLLKNDISLVPFNPENYTRIYCINITDGTGSDRARYFGKCVEDRISNVRVFNLTRNSKKYDYNYVLNEIKKADLILLPAFIDIKAYQGPINLSAEQTNFIGQVLKTGKPVILMSFKNPYLISIFPEATTYLNSFSHSLVSQNAMLRAILGEIDITGTQPVSIPGTYFIFGAGLSIEKSVSTTLVFREKNIFFPTIEYSFNKAISEKYFPGASVTFGYEGTIMYNKNFGTVNVTPGSQELTQNFSNDLYSLSQLLTIDLSILKLSDENKLKLDNPISDYLSNIPEEKKKITIRNLLYHNSGFGQTMPEPDADRDRNELITKILNQPLEFESGEKTFYSELNLVLLQLIIEKISGESLNDFVENNFINILGLHNTRFNLNPDWPGFQNGPGFYKWGKNSSEALASVLNNISGFRGLLTTNEDFAIIAQLLIQKGYYNGIQLIKAGTVSDLLDNLQDISSEFYYVNISKNIEGKTSSVQFIDSRGNSLWIDLIKKSFLIVSVSPQERNFVNRKFVELVKDLNSNISEELKNWKKK